MPVSREGCAADAGALIGKVLFAPGSSGHHGLSPRGTAGDGAGDIDRQGDEMDLLRSRRQRMKVDRLEIDELTVRRLTVVERE